jgi:uncharacterized protein involved in cysteine biosynthesis
MSLINDVQEEIKNLDTSEKRLRQFGLMVGAVLLFLTLWLFLKKYPSQFQYLLGITGSLLMTLGISYPSVLRDPYKIWMGGAFTLGWVVSRILLVAIFYLVLTPVGLTARLFGKDFLDIKMEKDRKSYWVKGKRNGEEEARKYERMY